MQNMDNYERLVNFVELNEFLANYGAEYGFSSHQHTAHYYRFTAKSGKLCEKVVIDNHDFFVLNPPEADNEGASYTSFVSVSRRIEDGKLFFTLWYQERKAAVSRISLI